MGFYYQSDNDELQKFEEEYGVKLKTKNVVCATCRGNGHIVNPAIDGNGLSREDFDEDPDFRENYLSGMYDIRCPECHGRNVTREVCREENSAEVLKDWDEWLSSAYETEAIYQAERRMGA